MVTSINYNEPNTDEYHSVKTGDTVFDSGDFIKDWFHSRKHITEISQTNWEPQSNSSSVDHFMMDGAKFDSAYLKEVEDEIWDLVYIDRTDPNWWVEDEPGIEFFVPEGEEWTWQQLKDYCKE
jgi:hypothetical protein